MRYSREVNLVITGQIYPVFTSAAVGTSLVCGNKSRICSHKMRFPQAPKESESSSATSKELGLGHCVT